MRANPESAGYTETRALPPLILHPFAPADSVEKLMEGSRAALMLHGLLPSSGGSRERLEEVLVQSRIQELRMLYFLGKDVLRWMEQCLDFVMRTPGLDRKGYRSQTFAAFLIDHTPDAMAKKLQVWGVSDHRSVFSRAIGLSCSFSTPPDLNVISPMFLENYHRFLDFLYISYQNLEPFTEALENEFSIEIFASAEYSNLLSAQWVGPVV